MAQSQCLRLHFYAVPLVPHSHRWYMCAATWRHSLVESPLHHRFLRNVVAALSHLACNSRILPYKFHFVLYQAKSYFTTIKFLKQMQNICKNKSKFTLSFYQLKIYKISLIILRLLYRWHNHEKIIEILVGFCLIFNSTFKNA